MSKIEQLTFPWSKPNNSSFDDFYFEKNNLSILENLKSGDDLVIYGLSKVGFEALDLIAQTSKEKGIDINTLLSSESYSFDSESLKNIAIKLEITEQMNVILDQLKDDVLGLPNKIIKDGGSLLEKFFLGN